MAEPQSDSIPSEVVDGLSHLKDALCAADYKPRLDYEFCTQKEITDQVTPLVKDLPRPDGIDPEVLVNVVHFTKPASIPVPAGSTAYVVPFYKKTEGAKVAGYALVDGYYWVITKDEQVEPDFYALLVLYNKKKAIGEGQ
ncbi:hypothetical protein F5Y10DRAFT_259505 [Nemania abortiva]|nr:hypothetical protein F5Y10DRAFT_259505 [Nemania abortiva]